MTDSGVAFVYYSTTGALIANLANPSPANGGFGGSVSVSGKTVVVGASSDNTGGQYSGQAYVFNATTGALIATLTNPSPAANDRFGFSVSMSDGSPNTVTTSQPDAG